MKCPSENILIEYIDNEVSLDLRNKIDSHILVCEKCRNRYIQLKEENVFIKNKLTNYYNFIDKNIRVAQKLYLILIMLINLQFSKRKSLIRKDKKNIVILKMRIIFCYDIKK